MSIRYCGVAVLSLLFLLSVIPAHAQCQLAFNEPVQEDIDLEEVLDLSFLDGIVVEVAQLPEVPPRALWLLSSLAYSLFETGDHERQAKLYQYILQHDRDPVTLYNLACCYSRMGEADLTAEYLYQAIRHGYDNLDYIGQDPDFEIIRGTARYQEIIDEATARAAERVAMAGEELLIECPTLAACRLILPEGYSPDKSYRLVIGLHGAGDLVERFGTLSSYFNDQDFIYAALQAPYAVSRENGGHVWYGGAAGASADGMGQTLELGARYIMGAIDGLKAQYNVDETYLIGFSQGGTMSYVTGITNPDAIDGIIVFGSGLNTEWVSDEAIAAAAGLRVFIAHGSEDNIERAQATRDLLEAHGYEVSYNEFPGGHFIHLDTLHAAEGWMNL